MTKKSAFVLALATLMLCAATAPVRCGRFEPHECACNEEKYGTGDPYGTVAAKATSDAVAEASSSGFALRDSFKDWQMAPPERSAYAHAKCDTGSGSLECSECLREAWANIRRECGPSVGARAVQWGCYLRYESYKFEY